MGVTSYIWFTCADPGIFIGGGGGGVQVNLTKKALTTFFLFFFSPQLIFLKSNGSFREKKGFRGGPTFSRRGPTFSRGGGGSNCSFPIETHITCDFPGGGGPDPLSPLWIRTWFSKGCVDESHHRLVNNILQHNSQREITRKCSEL